MQKETEIKLRVSRETLAALREHPLLNSRLKGTWNTHPLMNQYYDTPAHDLANARVALRLRRDGDVLIQTLKSRGRSVAGLSERNEWEWYLTEPQLDLAHLSDDCWPASLATLDKSLLQPVFTTDFVRTKADLEWSLDEQAVQVEAALDLGQVETGTQTEELCELELELRQGEPVALLDLAIALAETLPLMPCDISKAERGYRLHDSRKAQSLFQPELQGDMPLDEAVAQLFDCLLGNSQRLAEQYRFNGHWTVLEDWVAQLAGLRVLLGSLGLAAPRQSTQALRETLDALLADWKPRIAQGQLEAEARQAAQTLFAQELDQTRWGLFSLQAARWLLTRHWTQARPERGTRQGRVALERWLFNTLSDEAKALNLPHYEHNPQNLVEQQPRMERLLFWLQQTRSVLSLPEKDRLYGELTKAYAMTAQPQQEAPVLAAQIHLVWTLPGWKQLIR